MNDTYLPRVADAQLIARLEAVGAVTLEGVKGCGKTSTARQRAGSEVLLDVDASAELAARTDPRLVLTGETPRLLDEWQRVPRVWDAVRRAVDDRRRPGQFILTGSATPQDDVARHSGAGRIAVLRMRTMTLSEQQVTTPSGSVSQLMNGAPQEPDVAHLDLPEYVDRIVVGGWPALLGRSEADAREFLTGYVDAIVEHDVEEVSGARRNPRLVRRFLHSYAQVTAHPASIATIVARVTGDDAGDSASVSGPSRFTAGPYLETLRRMMVVDELPAWDPSVRSSARLTVTEKRLLADPSLAATLLGMSSKRLLADLRTLGFLFESLVAHDVRVYAEAAGASVFHYRERDGRLEVDLVIESADGDWAAIEVKLGDEAVDAAATSLLRLAERVESPPAALVVVTTGRYAYQREDGVRVVPLGCLGP